MTHEHEFEVIDMRSPDTWRIQCKSCRDVFDLTLTAPTCCAGFIENGKVWHGYGCPNSGAYSSQETKSGEGSTP